MSPKPATDSHVKKLVVYASSLIALTVTLAACDGVVRVEGKLVPGPGEAARCTATLVDESDSRTLAKREVEPGYFRESFVVGWSSTTYRVDFNCPEHEPHQGIAFAHNGDARKPVVQLGEITLVRETAGARTP